MTTHVPVRPRLRSSHPAPPSRRRKEPPIAGELPRSLQLVLGNEIYVAKERLPPGLRNRLLRVAAFQNPEFYKAQAMRFPTYDKPRIIACAEDRPHHIGLPRGCLDDVDQMLTDLKVRPVIRDERFGGEPLHVTFQGELRPEQIPVAEAMLKHETGVLSATTAVSGERRPADRVRRLGRMEVDLLCADSQIVVELDGAQHLSDPVAYRRDRRKDHLLQESGYFVLRFLADDVAKELDSVLDAILRSLSRRRSLLAADSGITVSGRNEA